MDTAVVVTVVDAAVVVTVVDAAAVVRADRTSRQITWSQFKIVK